MFCFKASRIQDMQFGKTESYMGLSAESREQGEEKRWHKRVVTLRLSLPGGVQLGYYMKIYARIDANMNS